MQLPKELPGPVVHQYVIKNLEPSMDLPHGSNVSTVENFFVKIMAKSTMIMNLFATRKTMIMLSPLHLSKNKKNDVYFNLLLCHIISKLALSQQ